MSISPDDTLKISFNENRDLFLHREDPDNHEIILQTFSLNRFETNVLLDALLSEPEYQDRAVGNLINKDLVRPALD